VNQISQLGHPSSPNQVRCHPTGCKRWVLPADTSRFAEVADHLNLDPLTQRCWCCPPSRATGATRAGTMASEVQALVNYYARTHYPRHIQTVCAEVLKKRSNEPVLLFWRAYGLVMEGSYSEVPQPPSAGMGRPCNGGSTPTREPKATLQSTCAWDTPLAAVSCSTSVPRV
jgi:hypothetical protein